jgi:hypothetical protein
MWCDAQRTSAGVAGVMLACPDQCPPDVSTKRATLQSNGIASVSGPAGSKERAMSRRGCGTTLALACLTVRDDHPRPCTTARLARTDVAQAGRVAHLALSRHVPCRCRSSACHIAFAIASFVVLEPGGQLGQSDSCAPRSLVRGDARRLAWRPGVCAVIADEPVHPGS